MSVRGCVLRWNWPAAFLGIILQEESSLLGIQSNAVRLERQNVSRVALPYQEALFPRAIFIPSADQQHRKKVWGGRRSAVPLDALGASHGVAQKGSYSGAGRKADKKQIELNSRSQSHSRNILQAMIVAITSMTNYHCQYHHQAMTKL